MLSPLHISVILEWSGLVDLPIDDNDVEPAMFLQNTNVLERITIYKNAVCKVSWPNSAQFMTPHEECSYAGGRSNDAFMRRKSEKVDEVLQISSIRAMWCPRKAIVPTRA